MFIIICASMGAGLWTRGGVLVIICASMRAAAVDARKHGYCHVPALVKWLWMRRTANPQKGTKQPGALRQCQQQRPTNTCLAASWLKILYGHVKIKEPTK